MKDSEIMPVAKNSAQLDNNGVARPVFNVSSKHLDMFISVILTQNTNRSVRLLNMVCKFLHFVDYRRHQHDLEYMARYFLLCKLLDYVLTHGLDARQAVGLCNNEYYNAEIQRCLNNIGSAQCSDQYLYIIEHYIQVRMNYIYLWENASKLRGMLDAIENGTLESVEETCEQAEALLSSLYYRIRRRARTSAHMEGYGSDNEHWLLRARAQRDAALRPGNRIRTSIKLLNEMLNGGFQRTRHYLFIIETGKGKSAFGLMMMYWAMMCNRGIQATDPTKRPMVLYLSYENLPGETLERELSFLYGRDVDISTQTDDDLMHCLKIRNELFGNPEDPSTLLYDIRYYPVNTFSPEDIDMLIEELQTTQNVEVVAVINDYSKRMRFNGTYTDERSRLGGIVDANKAIANQRNIVFIDFMQITRFAIQKVEQYQQTQQLGQVLKLEKTDIGESSLMGDNSDFVFVGTRELDSNGDMWMGIKKAKWRGMDSNVRAIYQPFYPGSGMRLVEDVNSPSPAGIVVQSRDGVLASNLADRKFRAVDTESLPNYAGPQAKHPHQRAVIPRTSIINQTTSTTATEIQI